MNHRAIMRTVQSLGACLLLALLPVSLAAQGTPAVPRGADGKPDLTGVWQAASNRRGTWEEANTGGIAGFNPGPRPEPPPYQPWAAKKVLESFNRRGIDDPVAACLPPGVPRVHTVGLFPMQIVQTPQSIVMAYEYLNAFRVIAMNAKHPDDLEPGFMGDSVGHWDGDTLVVDVTAFNDKTWLTATGTFHSEALHVTERFTRTDRDTIQYEATMEDPKVFTKPWVFRTTIMRRDGTRLREYACEENNVDRARYEELLKNESLFRRK
jgi:hypothetical protein